MKKRFYVDAKALKCGINFFINWKFDEMNRFLKKNYDYLVEEKWGNNTIGLYFVMENDNKKYYSIWIPEFSTNRNNIATLAHEIHHVVEAQSEEKAFECMETKAYLMEFYMKEVLKKYKLR